MSENRRRAERLKLTEPLHGQVEDGPAVAVIEVGLLGAKIEHVDTLMSGAEITLWFEWDEESLVFPGRVARSELQPLLSESRGETIYHSGVEFADADDRSSNLLRKLIADRVTRILEELKANARGGGSLLRDVPFLRSSRTTAKEDPQGFLSCRLDAQGQWHRSEVLKPRQPTDGFTVPLNYSEKDLEMLCQTYEDSDEAGRQMIRVCAELSISEGETVPPGSFR